MKEFVPLLEQILPFKSSPFYRGFYNMGKQKLMFCKSCNFIDINNNKPWINVKLLHIV